MELKHEQLLPLVYERLREYIRLSWGFELVAKATNSTEATVSGWLIGNEPNGERLIRLWHLLAALGFESPELEDLPKLNRYCGQLLTFGVVSLEEVLEIFGQKSQQRGLASLRGSPPMHPMFNYNQLMELYDDRLNDAKEQLLALGPSDFVTRNDELTAPQGMASQLVQDISRSGDPSLLLASLLGAARPLAQYLNSDESSPEERSRVRSLMGEAGMFEFSNILHSLCSERARNHGRQGQ